MCLHSIPDIMDQSWKISRLLAFLAIIGPALADYGHQTYQVLKDSLFQLFYDQK